MFRPNIPCKVSHASEDADLYGQKTVGPAHAEKCAVVKLRSESQHTTVRADSGASRGHADEFVTANRILLAANTKARIDDKLEVMGVQIRIKLMHPRLNTFGRVDHYEVEGELWA